MLSDEEKQYIIKALWDKLKIFRCMVYVMVIVCLVNIGIPIAIQYFAEGNILEAIKQLLGTIIFPALFFGGFYLLIVFLSGNQIFKFIKGDYTVSKEIISNKHGYYCDTQNHSRVAFAENESYHNAEIGGTVIVIEFGKNKSSTIAFVPIKDE